MSSHAPRFDLDQLGFRLAALLRTDAHLCNVLTHISSGDWRAVESAIIAILRPRASARKLSGLACNILQLICDERGPTGRILRPFFFTAIERTAGRRQMRCLLERTAALRRRTSLHEQRQVVVARRARTPIVNRSIHNDSFGRYMVAVNTEQAEGVRP